MKVWDEVKKDKELISKVEDLVNDAGEYFDNLPDEICCQLNELTGNDWKPEVYGEYCAYWWETPWNLKQVVYALFHDGEFPDRNEIELY